MKKILLLLVLVNASLLLFSNEDPRNIDRTLKIDYSEVEPWTITTFDYSLDYLYLHEAILEIDYGLVARKWYIVEINFDGLIILNPWSEHEQFYSWSEVAYHFDVHVQGIYFRQAGTLKATGENND